ncbi:LPXTG cell wall anchor domain-containing protein, partial [Streptococcus suis]|uniref:LPXTG cell wall anchor domain-containing protein n=1 Tax=Streptococcus suis TaxID=1307 RepID=UPI00077B9070
VTYVYAPEQTEIIPTENKAKVTVNYYILGTSTPLQPSYEDTPATKISETVTTNTYYLDANNERVPVGAPKVVTNPVDPAVTYNTTETKNGKEERPTTLESGGKTYHLVEAATTFTDGTGIRGNLTKDTVVNYYYAEIKDEVTTEPTNGSVTIKYESTDGTPLRDDKEDTSSTVISTKTTTKKYYVYNGEKVYVGDPVESTETKDLSYDTTEADKDEKPETLQKDGKTYQRVAVKAGSADENGKVTGDHVVTYVYAEIKEEVNTERTNGSVTIKYETVDGKELQSPFPDTPSTEISSITTKRKYYEYNGVKTYVGEAEVTPSTKDVPYNTTEDNEKPETLQKGGKTYQLVAVKAGSADEKGNVSGELVVTYVYAEVPEEPKPEEPKPEEPKPGEPTPPTDGGTTPPTDGGTTPPTDGGTTPPTDGGTTPPTDGGTTPPTDGGVNPPTDGGTTPPTDGGVNPPTDGGVNPPTDGGTTPPTDGGTTPPTDGGTTPPTDGGVNPPTDGGTTPPTDGGVNPPTDGGVNPPTDGGTTPPTDGGVNPPTDGGTTPPTDGGTTPPTDGGVNPPTDGGTTPPTDGGTTPTPPTGTITVTPKAGTAQLPNTGEASTSPLYGVLAFATGLAGLFGLVKKKKEEDQ